MASVDGTWECVVKSPLGDQRMTLVVQTSGGSFTGTATASVGSVGISGAVSGDTISWKQHVTAPMPLTLECEATADGDTLTGNVAAGAFGSYPMSGTRAG